MEKQFYTPNDLIAMGFGTKSHIYNLFHSEGFPSFKVLTCLRVSVPDFEKWVEEQKEKNKWRG
jgi:hypothetical protein